jgi:hypothetical protein
METPFYPIVEVFWKDHYAIGDEWYDEVGKRDVRIISAIGYLVDEDEDYYYIAANYDFGNHTFSSGTAVLKNCIIRRRVLSKGKFNYDQFSGTRASDENRKRTALFKKFGKDPGWS